MMQANSRARCIMVQGTMSGAGKSVLAAALCRIFVQDGWKVAPFKSQNMALNSFVTADGLEMGRAQAVQAAAARIEPDVRMNPILLKPSSDTGSQVIVNGEVRAQMGAVDYYAYKSCLVKDILAAYNSLAEEHDIIVIEGAGSPAEINLAEGDFVNMGLADLVDAPVILVGDIDRGGVFAQIYGTVALLEPAQRKRIVGSIINKFRGDVSILEPGLVQLEELCGSPVLGVVPYLDVDIDDEDSLAPRLRADAAGPGAPVIDIAVIRLPRISNFTDFAPLEAHPACAVRYVERVSDLGTPDLVIVPGTKSTMADLVWLRECGLEARLLRLASAGVSIWGICGGYQMLGASLSDPLGTDGGGALRGMGLLPIETVFSASKEVTRSGGVVANGPCAGATLDGYEIHMGETRVSGDPFRVLDDGRTEGCVENNVCGTYLHGLFDTADMVEHLVSWLGECVGDAPLTGAGVDHASYQDAQLDALAAGVRHALDMDVVYRAVFSSEQGVRNDCEER